MGFDRDSFVTIASILRTQGRHGAVRVRIEVDDARLFAPGRRVVLSLGDRTRETGVEELRSQHGRSVLKLEGVDSIGEAEAWTGARIVIARSDLVEAEQGAYFGFDLVGCEVYDNGVRIGKVAEVLDYGSAPLLRLEEEGREILVPFAEAFLKKVDTGAKRIDVALPEGLV